MSLPNAALRAVMRTLSVDARGALAQAGLGAHRRRRRGVSQVFREHRAYVAGDDVRQLDWRALARTGRPTIKTYEDEAQMHLLVGIDAGPSMHFGEGNACKLTAASTLAHALCVLALSQDDAAGLWTFGGRKTLLAPKAGPQQHGHVLFALASLQQRPLSAPMAAAPTTHWPLRHRRPHRVVLLGDWLGPWLTPNVAGHQARTPLHGLLSALAAAKHAVSVVHVVHPSEQNFPFMGPQQFQVDAQAAGVLTDATQAKPQYLAALARHATTLKDTCARNRATLHTLLTGEPLGPLLRALSAPG